MGVSTATETGFYTYTVIKKNMVSGRVKVMQTVLSNSILQ